MGVLLGDVNASARVDAGDVSLVRQQTLQTITTSNSEKTSTPAVASMRVTFPLLANRL